MTDRHQNFKLELALIGQSDYSISIVVLIAVD